jgi:hypothetical protein
MYNQHPKIFGFVWKMGMPSMMINDNPLELGAWDFHTKPHIGRSSCELRLAGEMAVAFDSYLCKAYVFSMVCLLHTP